MKLEKEKLNSPAESRQETIEKMLKEFKLSVQMDNSDLARGSLLTALDLAKKLGNLDTETRIKIADIIDPIK